MIASAQNQAVIETPSAPKTGSEKLKMTYEQFLAWADEDTLAEWVASPDGEAGEAIMYSPASMLHQELVQFLNGLLSLYVNIENLGKVLFAPFQVKLGPNLPGREPDLLFVAREHLGRLKPGYLDGPPDLIVEIISPGSREQDRGRKFYEYEEAGVREYWLIDPQRRQAEFYQLSAGGVYQYTSPDTDGIYHVQAIPGLWLRVEWLWREPLLNLVETFNLLAEMPGGAPGAVRLPPELKTHYQPPLPQ